MSRASSLQSALSEPTVSLLELMFVSRPPSGPSVLLESEAALWETFGKKTCLAILKSRLVEAEARQTPPCPFASAFFRGSLLKLDELSRRELSGSDVSFYQQVMSEVMFNYYYLQYHMVHRSSLWKPDSSFTGQIWQGYWI